VDVLAVWVSALGGDRVGERPSGILEDERVTHLWDDDGDIALFLGENPDLGVGEGFVYDVFLLFGPEAEFATLADHLETSGRTIIDASGNLEAAFADLGQLSY
jgi:hypothetical protein